MRAVRSAVKMLKKSEVVGMGARQSGTGAWDIKTKAPALVAQRKYRWGDKLPAGLALKQRRITRPTSTPAWCG
jgi:hypothetical protein